MGAATAAIVHTGITVLEPGDVAFQALGYAGYATVIVGGWTTANTNLYRAGLAGQGAFPRLSRVQVTLIVGLIVVAASVFPFVYRGYLSLVTYAGIVLVPVGGIIFAEHYVLPRLGLTRFWARYKGARNIPALLSWGVSLALAGVPIALDIMPVYFAFLPAWVIAIFLYTLFAKTAGAARQYPEGEVADEAFQERVEVLHAKQAEVAPTDVDTQDRRTFSTILKVFWIAALTVVFVEALFVLFSSSDASSYMAQRDQFYMIAAAGTVIYFACAYWELRRRRAFTKRRLAEHAAQ
jgi:hypothetical protein